MLRPNIDSVPMPESKSEIVAEITDYTPDDFEKLFQIVTNTSYDKTSYCAGGSTQLRQNLLNFMSGIFYFPNEKQLDVQARIIVSQIDMLIHRNVFNNILDSKILAAIKKDISNKCLLLKEKVTQDEREEFIATLIRMNAEAKATVIEVNMVPLKLQTGLTKDECDTIKYQSRFFQSNPGVDLFNKGITHFQKKEWVSAINQFELAVAAEKEMADELKKTVNKANLALYQKYIANAYNLIGLEFYNDKKYLEAIEFFKKTISVYSTIATDSIPRAELSSLSIYQRNLAISFNYAAIDFFFKGNIEKSIEYHQNTLTEFNKITKEQLTEEDAETLALYQRNLAFVVSEQGNNFYYQKNYAKAIECYNSAEKILQGISPGQVSEVDAGMVNRMKDKLKVASNAGQPNTSRLFAKRKIAVLKKPVPIIVFKPKL